MSQQWNRWGKCVATAVLALGCGLSTAAYAEDWKVTGEFGWFGVGKAQQLEKGHLFWVGEFSGTFFNDKGQGSLFHHAGVRCPGSNDVDSNKKKEQGVGHLRHFRAWRQGSVLPELAVRG